MEPVRPAGRAKPRQRAKQKQATRQRIYAAARKLFAEQGYFETRSIDIAKAAGVSSGSVFAHFGSKAKIMTAVTTEVFGSRIDRLKAAKWRSKDCLGRLREIVALLWDLNKEDKELIRACFSYAWVWDREDEEVFNRFIAERGNIVQQILEEADDWEEFSRERDVDFAFRLFQCFHENLVRESAHTPPDALFPRLNGGLDYVFSRVKPK